MTNARTGFVEADFQKLENKGKFSVTRPSFYVQVLWMPAKLEHYYYYYFIN